MAHIIWEFTKLEMSPNYTLYVKYENDRVVESNKIKVRFNDDHVATTLMI